MTFQRGGILMDSGEVRPVLTFLSLVQKQLEAGTGWAPCGGERAILSCKTGPSESHASVTWMETATVGGPAKQCHCG